MDKALKPVIFSCVLLALSISSSAQNCSSYSFSNNRQFTACMDLPVLNSSIHWNLDEPTNVVDIAFRHSGAASSRWAAWALNPSGQQMIGSQAIVSYQNRTGVRVYTSPISQFSQTTLVEGPLSFGVSNISATFARDVMTIYAKLQLTDELLSTNQVWQEGPLTGGSPAMHPVSGDNVRSVGTIDFRTGQT